MSLNVVDILSTSLEANGAILANTGNAANSSVGPCGGTDCEVWQPAGLISRPSKPSNGEAAQALIDDSDSSRDVCLAVRDVRTAKRMGGSIGEGETCVYANGPTGDGTGRVLLKDDGSNSSITLLIQNGNSSSGSPITLQLKSDGSFVLLVDDKGTSITASAGSLALVASNGALSSSISITPTEINLTSMKINVCGQGVLLGPVPTAATPCTIGPVGTTAVGSSSVLVSP